MKNIGDGCNRPKLHAQPYIPFDLIHGSIGPDYNYKIQRKILLNAGIRAYTSIT